MSGKSPKTYYGGNVVTFLNGSSSFLQLRRTTIKDWTSLYFVKIPPVIMALAPLILEKNL